MATATGAVDLVGRDRELDDLCRMVRAASAGAGGFVVIEGDPGIGKSALLDALAARAATEYHANVLRGRAWEEGGAPAYLPWREVAQSGRWAVDWEAHGEPFTLYQQVVGAARRAAEETDGPVLVLLDDVHAADGDTLRLIRYAARAIGSTSILLVVASRPADVLADLVRLGTHVLLDRLDDVDTDVLIGSRAVGGLDPGARAAIRSTAEGNPLLVCELTRSAVSGRPVSPGILAVVAPVVAKLDQQARAIVELAAVMGRAFRPERIARSQGVRVLEVLDALEPLRRAGVVTIAGQPPLGMFSHQLVRDVLYNELTPARRLELHAATAQVIATEDDPDSVVDHARHLLAAVPVVAPRDAVHVAVEAARIARARLAHTDAAALLGRALPLAADDPTRIELQLAMGADLEAAGRVGDASNAFEAALGIARAGANDDTLVRAVLARTELVAWGLPATELVPIVDEAIARANEPVGRARLLARRATLLATGTDLDHALVHARTALGVARESGDLRAVAEALAAAHRCCWRPGNLDEALTIGAELVEVATVLGDVELRSQALIARLIDHLRAGDVASVDADLASYAAFAAGTGRPRHQFFLDSRRAMRAFMAGRLAEGELLAERAFALGQQIEEPDTIQVFYGGRMIVVDELQDAAETLQAARAAEQIVLDGEARVDVPASHSYLRAGALDDARRSLRRLHGNLPALTLAHLPLYDLCLLSEVAVACGEHDIAVELWETLSPHAGSIVVNAGAVTFGGVVDEYLADLAQLLGRPGREAMLRCAADRYDQLGARWFAARVQRKLDTHSASSREPATPRTVDLHQRGDHWELTVDGRRSVLRDARGLHHLRVLLAAPNVDIAAVDLVGTQARELAGREAHHALLDERAKVAYRRRVRELQAELDAADSAADVERSQRARAELDLLLDELRRAVGLHGRDRPTGTIAERARVTVRKAIAAALERIAQHEPALAQQLRAWVQTGAWCVYRPDPLHPVNWQLD